MGVLLGIGDEPRGQLLDGEEEAMGGGKAADEREVHAGGRETVL